MPVSGDLGFRFAAFFFLFVVFPAIGFVIRRKWRLAVARQEEIKRLLVLASEEAARAELEASIGYSTTPLPVPSYRHCAVCYTPTPNRCGRCKLVHYCSSKCQIIHWRQGHKDECHPPLSSFDINDEAISFVGNAVKQSYPDDYISSTGNGIHCAKQGETAPEKPEFTNPFSSPSECSVKDDIDTVGHSRHGKEPDPPPELHDILASSGVQASSSGDGMCLNDSISDDDSLHEPNSDSCDSSSTFDNLETPLSDRNVEQTKPLQEKSQTRIKSDGNVCSDKNSTELPLSNSGFWDGSLDSNITRKYVNSNNSIPNGYDNVKFSDAKSSTPLSFNLSANFSTDLHSQGSEVSGDTYPGNSRTVKLVVEPILPENESKDATRHRRSTSLSSKMSESRVKEINSDEDFLKSKEVRPRGGTTKDSGLPACSSERANDLERGTKDTLQSPVSKKSGLSPQIPNHPSSSGMKGHDAPALKPVKSGVNAHIAPQVARLAPSTTVGLKTSMLKVVEQLRAPRSTKESGIVGRKNEKGIFPYELFVKLYHWNKVELHPRGLINCGNSCYANAVLQCLAFTPPLTAYLLQGLHSKACVRKEWCFTCEFERLILKMKEVGPPLSPIGIVSQIQKIGSHLTNGREEDAHEFLRYAIDTMQSICLQEAGLRTSSSLEEETNLTGLTFGGYLRSKIKCTRCHGKSERQERMMDLTVEIEGDIETLDDALRKFTGTESLDGENKYHCGRCKSYEKAKKKLSILEAPNVLTIALKRFQSGKFGKLNKSIQFPEILNLAPYMRGTSDKSPIYRLYGVVVHLDVMNAAFSGHYLCYVRNAQNKWYKIDDSTVKPVELGRVLNTGAYMLFYSRCSPRAPRSIRSTIISRDLSNKIKIPEVDSSRNNGRNTSSRLRASAQTPDDLANPGYAHRDETRIPNILELDSSSDNSSLFSHSDEVSSSTDSNRESITTDDISEYNRESITTDDISEYIFGYNAFWRHSSDSDTSSSSSSSSSPLYTKHSPLSNSDRYASGLYEPSPLQSDNTHSIHGVSGFLHSNSSKQDRKLVNISSCRGAESERLERANPLDNAKNGVYLRRSFRKKAD